MEEMHKARCVGKGHKVSMPSPAAPLSEHIHLFSNLEALRTPSYWRAHYVDMLDEIVGH